MGIAPTGSRVTTAGMTIDRVANGKIAETWDNYDAMGMMQQLGVIPSSEQAEA
jgi:predicted ester cyclase